MPRKDGPEPIIPRGLIGGLSHRLASVVQNPLVFATPLGLPAGSMMTRLV